MDCAVTRPAADAPVAARSDVVVVGGGPAGLAAAVSAARGGASVTLLERYAHLGGLAAGGMVLVLDDFADGPDEITVRGLAQEMVDRLHVLGLAVYPPPGDRLLSSEMWQRWSRWGLFDLYAKGPEKSIVYAVAFDPDGWKRVSNDLVEEAGVDVRLHSWYSAPIMFGDTIGGVICETKTGPQAVLGDVVIDASGDADVAAGAGAPHVEGSYMVTTVFRLGNVDTDTAERFEHSQPAECHALNRRARRILGGSWAMWWLKTPLRGVVWCNCPHMNGYDGLSVEDLTAADREGRKRIADLVEYVREHYPGFENAVVIDVAPQIGVRQSRLIEGEYVVTKDDVVNRVHFTDSVARGRGYYTPYRAMLPQRVEQLLVAGRHYSVTPEAQKLSREIPPCMSMGEAAGTAAVEALDCGVTVRKVDVAAVQRRLRRQGADPGDIPSLRARRARSTPEANS
ncbi:MAG: FAD-dependent oxidoreductase [Acidimicrobiia bacterium]|nr:FAD-dependent oxidoreductase [Acidimicrobiaceae bacterium]MYH95960.1 FAD-dependent oxidoreductase [Acidimicrobiia bacterium]